MAVVQVPERDEQLEKDRQGHGGHLQLRLDGDKDYYLRATATYKDKESVT